MTHDNATGQDPVVEKVPSGNHRPRGRRKLAAVDLAASEANAEHEAAHAEERAQRWREGGEARRALFDDYPREVPLDFGRPLPVPEEVLEDFVEVGRIEGMLRGEDEQSSYRRFATEGARVAHHNGRDELGGTLAEAEWLALKAAFGGVCAYCEEPQAIVLEHVVALKLGGRTCLENVVPGCHRCNRAKGTLTVVRWKGVVWAAAFAERHARAIEFVRAKTSKPAT